MSLGCSKDATIRYGVIVGVSTCINFIKKILYIIMFVENRLTIKSTYGTKEIGRLMQIILNNHQLDISRFKDGGEMHHKFVDFFFPIISDSYFVPQPFEFYYTSNSINEF